MELAIGALELQNSLYFSLFAGNCVGDRFAGDCFHHHPVSHEPYPYGSTAKRLFQRGFPLFSSRIFGLCG